MSLREAKEFAIQAHSNQMYSQYRPYKYHLQKVAEVLQRFGYIDRDLLAAAWLHDSIEDTSVTLKEIEVKFGWRVAELVWAVTDEPGKNRKERHQKTYPKINKVYGATALKLADRIANVEECIETNDKKLKMYKTEYGYFSNCLRKEHEAKELWEHLDKLLEG